MGYTLCQVWEILCPAFITNNDLATCAPFIKWMCVVLIGIAIPGSANDIGATSAVFDLQAPLADQDLILHPQKLLKQMLPALYQPVENLE